MAVGPKEFLYANRLTENEEDNPLGRQNNELKMPEMQHTEGR